MEWNVTQLLPLSQWWWARFEGWHGLISWKRLNLLCVCLCVSVWSMMPLRKWTATLYPAPQCLLSHHKRPELQTQSLVLHCAPASHLVLKASSPSSLKTSWMLILFVCAAMWRTKQSHQAEVSSFCVTKSHYGVWHQQRFLKPLLKWHAVGEARTVVHPHYMGVGGWV